jgi:hypothetical protein
MPAPPDLATLRDLHRVIAVTAKHMLRGIAERFCIAEGVTP